MLLQYPVQFHLFSDHGRLNPHDVELEDAGDCGANTLFLLGLIDRLDAIELSRQQNICWINKRGMAFTMDYLLKTYLFIYPTKQYDYKQCTQKQLMTEVQVLKGGYGTFLFMKDAETNLGHFTCIYKNIYTEEIEIADLQTEEIISNIDESDRLDNYLSQYDLFCIPFELDASSLVRRHTHTSESLHGSPAKTIPIRDDSYSSPTRRNAASSPELKRSRRDHSFIENINAFDRRETERPISPLPLTPQPSKKKRGGKRKRRTCRKN